MPWPPPIQRLASPHSRSLRSIWPMSVTIMRAPGAANGVADGDAASQRVRLLHIAFQFPHAADGLGGEGLIQFNGAKIVDGKPGCFEDLSHGGDRAEAHDRPDPHRLRSRP